MVKLYEIAFFINPDIKEEEVSAYVQKIKDFIVELGGDISKEQPIQKKKLAYPIKKAKQGYFSVMLFNLGAENLKSLDKKLKLEDFVLRYLVIAADKDYLAQMKKQEEEIKEKFQRITQPQESTKKATKTEDKTKLEEIEKKLEELLG